MDFVTGIGEDVPGLQFIGAVTVSEQDAALQDIDKLQIFMVMYGIFPDVSDGDGNRKIAGIGYSLQDHGFLL